MIGGRVLDVSAITDIAVGRSIYGAAFLAAANDLGIPLAVPTAALQQAWAGADDRDHPFLDLLLSVPLTIVADLDTDHAVRSGLLGRPAHLSGTWDAAAAHTVLVAHDRGWPVLTADPGPLRSLDPGLELDVLPAP